MNILYLGNFTLLGSPLGYSPTAEHIALSFEIEGHSVRMMNECDFSAKEIIEELKKKVMTSF